MTARAKKKLHFHFVLLLYMLQ